MPPSSAVTAHGSRLLSQERPSSSSAAQRSTLLRSKSAASTAAPTTTTCSVGGGEWRVWWRLRLGALRPHRRSPFRGANGASFLVRGSLDSISTPWVNYRNPLDLDGGDETVWRWCGGIPGRRLSRRAPTCGRGIEARYRRRWRRVRRGSTESSSSMLGRKGQWIRVGGSPSHLGGSAHSVEGSITSAGRPVE